MTTLAEVWREVQQLPEAKTKDGGYRKVFIDFGGDNFYANIRHEGGYVVWYHKGKTPLQAMKNLRDGLNEIRGKSREELLGTG